MEKTVKERTIERSISRELIDDIEETKRFVKNKFNLNPVNNVNLLLEEIYRTKNLEGDIVECGVYSGATIFCTAHFCNNVGINKKILGFDTFSGFPGKILSKYDKPEYFKELFKEGLITKEHFEKASARTDNFTLKSHLEKSKFSEVGNIFEHSANFDNIKLIKGTFANTLPKYKDPISVLYLDCDLYESYIDSLSNLYDQVKKEGSIIFDEFYSLKYPGPCMAVNNFFSDKKGYFSMFITREGFERWCFVKEE